MTAALTIVAVVSISVLVIRIGGVALQQTGLSQDVARFQAMSVFTGCGFTTTESETVVNYPVRRRIALTLMVIGNIGLVGVLSTVVVSFVGTDGSAGAISKQILWLMLGVALILACLFNKRIDAAMCRLIGWALHRYTEIGKRDYTRLLQIVDGYSICEHTITDESIQFLERHNSWIEDFGFRCLAVENEDGHRTIAGEFPEKLSAGDKLVLFGPDAQHERFAKST